MSEFFLNFADDKIYHGMISFGPNRYLIMLAALLLAWCLWSCGPSSQSGMEEEIREYVMSQMKSDTTGDGREIYRTLDTMSLSDKAGTEEMYRIIHLGINRLHQRRSSVVAMKTLRGMADILEGVADPTPTDIYQLVVIYVRLGAWFKDSGMPSISLDYYMKGLEYCNDSASARLKAMLYNNIGVLYAEGGIYGKGEEYFKRSLELNMDLNIHHEVFRNYANLAELYTLTGDIAKAMEATQSGLDHLDAPAYPILLAQMRVQQGDLYARQGQWDVAMMRYQSGLSLYRDRKYRPGEVETDLHISDAYIQRGMPDSARIYALDGIALARQAGLVPSVAEGLRHMSRVGELENRPDSAMAWLRQSMELEDSLRAAEGKLRLTNWELYVSEMPDHVTGSGQIPAWIYLAVSLLGCACVASGIIALRSAMSCKAMERERGQVHEAHGNELEEIARRHGIELEQRDRELTTMALEKVKVNEGISVVAEEMKGILVDLAPKEAAKRSRIRGLVNRMDLLVSEGVDDEFKNYFARVHPGLFRILDDRYPDLTPRDRRLCAFLYLGLTTKEIASLTYREVRSVESARNRLRKKLGVELSDDLTGYLRGLTE